MRGANEQRLINDYALSRSDFFTTKVNDKNITILRRTGVDKIMDEVELVIDDFSVKLEVVAGFCVAVATIKAHLPEDPLNIAWTCASASPENCMRTNNRYAETAETRAKHRAVLTLLGLYKYGIETVDASATFEMLDPGAKKNVQEKAEAKPIVKKDPSSELQDAMEILNKKRAARKKTK